MGAGKLRVLKEGWGMGNLGTGMLGTGMLGIETLGTGMLRMLGDEGQPMQGKMKGQGSG